MKTENVSFNHKGTKITMSSEEGQTGIGPLHAVLRAASGPEERALRIARVGSIVAFGLLGLMAVGEILYFIGLLWEWFR